MEYWKKSKIYISNIFSVTHDWVDGLSLYNIFYDISKINENDSSECATLRKKSVDFFYELQKDGFHYNKEDNSKEICCSMRKTINKQQFSLGLCSSLSTSIRFELNVLNEGTGNTNILFISDYNFRDMSIQSLMSRIHHSINSFLKTNKQYNKRKEKLNHRNNSRIKKI